VAGGKVEKLPPPWHLIFSRYPLLTTAF